MSGKLYMLTPISSPMVTRPTSPTAASAEDAKAALISSANSKEDNQLAAFTSGAMKHNSNGPSRLGQICCNTAAGPQQQSCKHDCNAIAFEEASPFAVATAQAATPASPNSSPRNNSSMSSRASSGDMHLQRRWRSPPCCKSCGTAKADGGTCSGCGGSFCKACMQPEEAPASEGDSKAARSGLGGPCNNCSSLCSACKPIACSFCELGDCNRSARMCEACSGTCDSCKRAACSTCAASFAACSSCGYATCEECQLQSQMAGEATAGVPAGAVGGCWCAPPLRSASNVRHISSQRYQMAHLHPSMLASSMEAAGLRDADFDDYDAYDDADGMYESEPQQQLDADTLDAHHRHWAAAEGVAGLDSKTLGAVLGSIGYGLSPGSSSFSSSSHLLHGSYQGSGFAAAAATTGMGRFSGHQQQHAGLVLAGSVK